ncbi:MAG: nucleotidyl transferase AbiEii/AbiGii toxin family protein [Verrucomicrobia bacterium]|nr:nucleotidyl transferase AbiEii/AbiGii toxin family protein [Verrucomicrobiota bacterium]
MKAPKPLDLQTVVRTFEAIPELAGVGAFAGANALYLEHIENPLGRFSLDIDLQNQSEEIETIHRRLSPQTQKKLKLVSRLNAEMYAYQTRVGGQTIRIELARPYLRHRKKYKPSKHVPGLAVVSLADLMFAKVSALSTRGFARDLIDLFAIDQQRGIDWQKLLAQAARASDNDYNPAEFLWKLQSHHCGCVKRTYAQELPVIHPPVPSILREFIERLMAANQAVAQATLRSKPPQQ